MAKYPETTTVPIFNPLSESIKFKTMIQQFDDMGVEQRKRKWMYPRRDFSLKYKGITRDEIETLYQFYIARYGSYEAFNFFYPTGWDKAGYKNEYVGRGDGETLLFNMPCRNGEQYIIMVDGVAKVETTDYTWNASGGADGADQIEFNIAPTDGDVITADFTGHLKVHCRFAEDNMDFETLINRIVNTGLKLKGLLNQ